MASPHPSPTLVETKHEAPDAKSRVSTETSFNNPAQDLTPPTSVGVKRMEAVARAGEKRPVLMWTIRICVLITAWVYTLQHSVTLSLQPIATSRFSRHSSGLGATAIATEIIGSVCQPFVAKISDIVGRSACFTGVLFLYTLGLILIASAPTITGYVVGQVFNQIGYTGISFICGGLLPADLIALKWRGFARAMTSAPFIINAWIAGYIVDALSTGNKWRWGYGMFAIIAPVVITPAIATMIWLEHRAVKAAERAAAGQEIGDAKDVNVAVLEDLRPSAPLWQRLQKALIEIDTFGLLLLGFGWSLLLLPFSLKAYADNGYSNRSLIAMFVVGGLLLIIYAVWELKFAPFPTFTLRILNNRTLLLSVLINVIWMLAGFLNSLYLSSYALVATDWTIWEWTVWNNALTMALCIGGLVAGIVQRITHRYKMLQIGGLSVKIIGYGLLVKRSGPDSTARLVTAQILTGFGGSFAVVGTSVAAQASVPHQDVALVLALISLCSAIGASIGSAISVSVWSSMMPGQLRANLPASVTDEEVITYFGDITQLKSLPFDSEIRQGALVAYANTVWHLWPAALGLSFVALLAACFQKNYYLGDQQNCYDCKGLDGEVVDSDQEMHEAKVRSQEPLWKFWKY